MTRHLRTFIHKIEINLLEIKFAPKWDRGTEVALLRAEQHMIMVL